MFVCHEVASSKENSAIRRHAACINLLPSRRDASRVRPTASRRSTGLEQKRPPEQSGIQGARPEQSTSVDWLGWRHPSDFPFRLRRVPVAELKSRAVRSWLGIQRGGGGLTSGPSPSPEGHDGLRLVEAVRTPFTTRADV